MHSIHNFSLQTYYFKCLKCIQEILINISLLLIIILIYFTDYQVIDKLYLNNHFHISLYNFFSYTHIIFLFSFFIFLLFLTNDNREQQDCPKSCTKRIIQISLLQIIYSGLWIKQILFFLSKIDVSFKYFIIEKKRIKIVRKSTICMANTYTWTTLVTKFIVELNFILYRSFL